MSVIRLVVADDEPVVVAGLCATLNDHAGIAIAGTVFDGVQALKEVRTKRPDVVLIDTSLPGIDGFQTTEAICGPGGVPTAKVLMFGSSDSDECLFRALRVGAKGFIRKDCNPDQLIKSIHLVHSGQIALSPNAVTRVVSAFARIESTPRTMEPCISTLTCREREVLELVLRGLRTEEITQWLSLTSSTVKCHTRSICRKLNVRDRVGLVIYAYEHGLHGCIRPGSGA